MKAWRLDTRSILPFSNQENALSSHLLSCLTTVHHFLFLRPFHGWIHEEIFEIWSQKMKETICFLLMLSSMGEWSHSCCDVGNCQLPFAFSQNFIWILQERVVVALLRRLYRSRWRNLYFWSVACDFRDIWAYNVCFLQLADC